MLEAVLKSRRIRRRVWTPSTLNLTTIAAPMAPAKGVVAVRRAKGFFLPKGRPSETFITVSTKREGARVLVR